MAKIFLDCGAWNGYSVEVFRREYDIDCEYMVHSFEPNPRYSKSFPKFDRHMFHDNAVWIEDGYIDFYLDNTTKKKAGSSVIREKITGNLDKKHPITVRCIDMDKWIKDNLNLDDFIILKLDIEGAEYKVLSHMIENGSIEYINNIFIEWHWHKILLPEREHHDLVNKIKIPIDTKWKVGKGLK